MNRRYQRGSGAHDGSLFSGKTIKPKNISYASDEIDANPNHDMIICPVSDLPRGSIVYYCKDCKQIVEAKPVGGKKLKYRCSTCNGDNVAYGTEKSVKSVYKIKEPE